MMRAIARFALFAAVSSPVFAAGALFPAPLHLTRQIDDAGSSKTTIVNEYGYGNRLISVRGAFTSIADYERGELTEIDRDAGTYSITRFEAIAKAYQAVAIPGVAATGKKKPELRPIGAKATKSGRSAEFFEGAIGSAPARQTIQVAFDRSVTLSRGALEVLLGAAYPGVPRSEHELILSGAAPNHLAAQSQSSGSGTSEQPYALPIEEVISYEFDGQKLETRSSIVRVGSEPPPADMVSIPAGARLVVSRIVAVNQELEQITHPTAVSPRAP
jgi:hypothetical protein